MNKRLLFIILAFCGISVFAKSGESNIHLKEGPGKDLVLVNCMMCHSLDYIQMNSRFLDRAGWEAVVIKMKNMMGAPIKSEDVSAIVDYLDSQYGKVPEATRK